MGEIPDFRLFPVLKVQNGADQFGDEYAHKKGREQSRPLSFSSLVNSDSVDVDSRKGMRVLAVENRRTQST